MIIDRIGLVLVSPRAAVRAAAAGQGSSDVTWLLALRVVCGETPRVVRALVRLGQGEPVTALMGLVGAASAVLPDVLGILTGAIVLSLLGGRKKPDRTLDVAAYAWVPYLAVSLAGALVFSGLSRPMRPLEERVVNALAVGWATVVWLLGLVELRRESAS